MAQMEVSQPVTMGATAVSGSAQVLDVTVTTQIIPASILPEGSADQDQKSAYTGTVTAISPGTAPIAIPNVELFPGDLFCD